MEKYDSVLEEILLHKLRYEHKEMNNNLYSIGRKLSCVNAKANDKLASIEIKANNNVLELYFMVLT